MPRRSRVRLGVTLAPVLALLTLVSLYETRRAEAYPSEAGGWRVHDEQGTDSRFCVMDAVFEDGVTLDLTWFDSGNQTLFIYSKKWNITNNGSIPVRISIGNNYDEMLSGQPWNKQGIALPVDDVFISAFRFGSGISVHTQSGELRYNLAGTNRGYIALEACAREALGYGTSNPFEAPSSLSNPFGDPSASGPSNPASPATALTVNDERIVLNWLRRGGVDPVVRNRLPDRLDFVVGDVIAFYYVYRDENVVGTTEVAEALGKAVKEDLRESCSEPVEIDRQRGRINLAMNIAAICNYGDNSDVANVIMLVDGRQHVVHKFFLLTSFQHRDALAAAVARFWRQALTAVHDGA